jgi:hypothetical protein
VKYALPLAAVLALAGCASSGDTQVAQADCKVAPVTPASVSGAQPKRVDPLAQRQAEADLRSTEYGRRQIAANNFGTVAEALRDCDRR